MVDLGGNLDVNLRASKVSENGQVLCETFDSVYFQGLVWSDATGLADLGSLDASFPLTIPNAMNSSGVVVGASRDRTGLLRAVAWTSETGMVELGAPGWSEALAVNDLGQVVGYGNSDAFVWDPEYGAIIITPPDARFAVATSVNNLGQVVGYAELSDRSTKAFMWSPDLGHVDLGMLAAQYPNSLALAINDSGHIVGQALGLAAEVKVRAFLWTPETGMQDVGESRQESWDGPLPETDLMINALGQIIGTYGDEQGLGDPRAFLWTESGQIYLDDDTEWIPQFKAANNRNQIVGSMSAEQQRLATLWEVKTSEPASK
jgi:probable HAF family extracellular repeat protein